MARISVEEPIEEESETNQADVTKVVKPDTSVTAPEPQPPEEQLVTPKPPLKLKPNTVYIAICALVVMLLLGALISQINSQNNLRKENDSLKRSSPQASTLDEAEQLKAEIGQFIDLPADETPTVATVSDASKVKDQSFFVNAQNGDKVLLFAKAGKAILYRPSSKKIIEVAPINLNSAPATSPTLPPATRR